jgi:hypothetical protein
VHLTPPRELCSRTKVGIGDVISKPLWLELSKRTKEQGSGQMVV